MCPNSEASQQDNLKVEQNNTCSDITAVNPACTHKPTRRCKHQASMRRSNTTYPQHTHIRTHTARAYIYCKQNCVKLLHRKLGQPSLQEQVQDNSNAHPHMHKRTCTQAHTQTHTYTHAHTQRHTGTTHTHMHTHTQTRTHTCTSARTNSSMTHMHMHMHQHKLVVQTLRV